MKYTVRALLAVALLAGFYVVAALVAGIFVVLAVLAARSGTTALVALKLGVLALVVVTAVVRGLLAARRRRGPGAPSFLLSPQDQPALWAEIRTLAGSVGTRPPDEIALVADANAGVTEDSRFLGLVGGRRRLELGLPLLLGLSPLQLRAVLAHELGHYGSRHTALGPVTYRGRQAIGRALGKLGPRSWLALPLRWYALLYLAVSSTVSRRQELEADAFAAQLAGSEAAAGALRDIAPVRQAWDHFLQQYAGLGAESGLRPAPLLAAFATMLADAEVRTQLDALREEPDATVPSRFDSHPPTGQRIAELRRLALPAPAGPAPGPLLARPDETITAFEEWLFRDSDRRATPWDDVVDRAGAGRARQQRRELSRLAGSEATYDRFVSRIGHRVRSACSTCRPRTSGRPSWTCCTARSPTCSSRAPGPASSSTGPALRASSRLTAHRWTTSYRRSRSSLPAGPTPRSARGRPRTAWTSRSTSPWPSATIPTRSPTVRRPSCSA
ncbi:M48 family metalloprotease [Pimelobacter simplex]|uniref:M48 family metalloprotease n=1 Tax=Nocardioides simplex TaxID=2045 RepID=UPI003AAF5C03